MSLSQGSKRFQNIKQFCLFDAKEDIKIHCPELIKLAEIIPKIKILTQTFLGTYGFPNCLGAADSAILLLRSQHKTIPIILIEKDTSLSL